MKKEYNLEILTTAQYEIEEIASVHMKLSGPKSAEKITDKIYSALEKLETFPEMGLLCKDKHLAALGYRMLVCGNYLCFYRQLNNIIYIHHVADGRSDYPKLLSDLTEQNTLKE